MEVGWRGHPFLSAKTNLDSVSGGIGGGDIEKPPGQASGIMVVPRSAVDSVCDIGHDLSFV